MTARRERLAVMAVRYCLVRGLPPMFFDCLAPALDAGLRNQDAASAAVGEVDRVQAAVRRLLPPPRRWP